MRTSLFATTLASIMFATILSAPKHFSTGMGNPTDCSPGETNEGCSFGGGPANPRESATTGDMQKDHTPTGSVTTAPRR